MNNPFFNPPQMGSRRKKQGMYDDFDATELYCPRCGQAMPVRKRLLLVLPEGEKYEYLCQNCLTSVGTKVSKDKEQINIII